MSNKRVLYQNIVEQLFSNQNELQEVVLRFIFTKEYADNPSSIPGDVWVILRNYLLQTDEIVPYNEILMLISAIFFKRKLILVNPLIKKDEELFKLDIEEIESIVQIIIDHMLLKFESESLEILEVNVIKKILLAALGILNSVQAANQFDIFGRLLKLIYGKQLIPITSVYLVLFHSSISLLKTFCLEERKFIMSSGELINSFCRQNKFKNGTCQQLMFVRTVNSSHILSQLFDWSASEYEKEKDWLPNWISKPNDYCTILNVLVFLKSCHESDDKLKLLQDLEEILNDSCLVNQIDSLLLQECEKIRRDWKTFQFGLQHYKNLNASKFLRLLQEHSPLYAMQASIPMYKLPFSKVLDLLSYHKNVSEIYRAFYIILISFTAIISGIEMDKTVNAWQLQRLCLYSVEESEFVEDERDINACQSYYKRLIAKQLEYITYIFEDISCNKLAVEILENLFSLFFVTNTSLSDDGYQAFAIDEGEASSPSSLKQDMDDYPSNSSITSTSSAFHFDSQYQVIKSTCKGLDLSLDHSFSHKESSSVFQKKSCNKIEIKEKETATDPLNDNKLLHQDSSESPPMKYLTQCVNIGTSDISSSSSVQDFSNCGYLMNSIVLWDHLLLLQSLTSSLQFRKDFDRTVSEGSLFSRLTALQNKVENALWKIKVLAPEYQDRHLGSTREIGSYMRGTLFSNASPLVQYDMPRVHKSRKRKSGDRKKLKLKTTQLSKANLTNFLLSSSENLLSISLVSGNLESAQKIIDKYQLESIKETQELILMKCLSKNVPQIEQLDHSKNKKSVKFNTDRHKRSGSSELHSSDFSISCLIDQTLSLSLLGNSPNKYSQNNKPFVEMCPKLILLDIGLTSKISKSNVLKLWQSATKQQGISIIQEHLCEEQVLPSLLTLIDESPKLDSLFKTIQNMKTPTWSFNSCQLNPMNWFLSNWSLEDEKQQNVGWEELVECLSKFNCNSVEQKASKYNESPNYPCLTTIYNSVLEALPENKTYDYLSLFINYLQNLGSIIDQHSNNPASNDKKDVFMHLNERPVQILGDLIFKCGIDPSKLESFSNHIHLDLLLVITKYVFPSIPINPTSVSTRTLKVGFSDFGCQIINNKYVLNASHLICEKSTHGDFVVRDLLTSLLDRIKDMDYECNLLKENKILCGKTAPLFIRDSQMKDLLNETNSIASSDLKQIKNDFELFIFFVNLCNLMFVHCALINSLIFNSVDNQGGIFSKSKFEQYIAMKSVGYFVGPIGFVSLFDLIFNILKQPLFYEICGEEKALVPFLKRQPSEFDPELQRYIDELEGPLLTYSPYLAFILSQPLSPSVKMQVYYPYTFEDALTESIEEYFTAFITQSLSTSCYEASLNPVLTCFLVSFPSTIDQAIESLKNYSPEEFTFYLDSLRKINIKRTCSSSNLLESFSIRLEYYLADEDSDLDVSLGKRSRSLEKFSLKKSSSPELWKDIKKVPPQVISYINQNCPIIAILMLNQFLDKNSKLEPKLQCNDYLLQDCTFLHNLISLTQAKNDEGKEFFGDKLSCLLSLTSYESVLNKIELTLSQMSSESYRNSAPHSVFLEMIEHFSSIPKMVLLQNSQLSFVWNQLLNHVSATKLDSPTESLKIVYKMIHLNDKIDAVRQNFRVWPLDLALQCLYYLDAEKCLTADQQRIIQQKIDKLEIYDEILRLPVKNSNLRSSQDVYDLSVDTPKVMLVYLKDHRCYNLLVKWVTAHDLKEKFSFEMTLSHLLCYLDVIEPNIVKAKSILEEVSDDQLKDILQELLKVINNHLTRSFLIQFYLNKISDSSNENCSSKEEVFDLRQELMGLILVENVAPKYFDRTQLFPLISKPHLILEQWVMNVKFEAVEKAIELLTPHLNNISEDPICDALSWHQFHSIVETYAFKALEMSGIQVTTMHRLRISSIPGQFVIPLEVPSKSEWENNSSVSICHLCTISVFSLFSRRHHCRRCGRVVCASCSRNRYKVEGYKVPVRVCSFCYQHLCPKIKPSVRTHTFSDTSEESSTYSDAGWYFTTDLSQVKSIREEFSFDCAPSLSLCQAILSLHKDDKRASLCILKLSHKLFVIAIDSINAEFSEVDSSFILRMIGTLLSCAKIRFSKSFDEEGIALCEYYNQWVDLLSLLIADKCQRLLPPEALPNMISVAELRKLKLSGAQVDSGKIFHNLEKELRYVKVLRDSLVKGEKWKLALNVSTKAGFESNGVWGAWAMASLKAGDFATARENFSKILSKPRDKNIHSRHSIVHDIISFLENHPQLFKIKLSEKNSEVVIPGSTSDPLIITQTLMNLNSIADGKLNLVNEFDGALPPKKRSLDPILQRECEYYIRLYGCHRMLLEFLLRHNRVLEAVKYCYQMDVHGDIFSEVVVLTFFQKGQFAVLWKKIKQVDSSQSWSCKILLSTCKWLDKNKYHHCLLEVQKHLKDYLRVAMTLTRMYAEWSDSFSEMMNRKHYLDEISAYLQSYLNLAPMNESPQCHKAKGLASLCLHSSSWLVNQQIHFCTFQEDSVKFLAEIEQNVGSLRPLIINIQSCLSNLKPLKGNYKFRVPTAFNKEERLIMSVALVCSGGNINLSLSIVHHLIEINALQTKEFLSLSLEVLRDRRNLNDIPTLIEGIFEWGLIADSQKKALLEPTMQWAAESAPNYVNRILIGFLPNDKDKANAFIKAGLLKQAYYILMEEGTKMDMENLLLIAIERNDEALIFKCRNCLDNFHQPSIIRQYEHANKRTGN